MQQTLEEYFKHNYGQVIEDFNIHISKGTGDKMSFYIHPDSYNGDTLDFIVDGNTLVPKGE